MLFGDSTFLDGVKLDQLITWGARDPPCGFFNVLQGGVSYLYMFAVHQGERIKFTAPYCFSVYNFYDRPQM